MTLMQTVIDRIESQRTAPNAKGRRMMGRSCGKELNDSPCWRPRIVVVETLTLVTCILVGCDAPGVIDRQAEAARQDFRDQARGFIGQLKDANDTGKELKDFVKQKLGDEGTTITEDGEKLIEKAASEAKEVASSASSDIREDTALSIQYANDLLVRNIDAAFQVLKEAGTKTTQEIENSIMKKIKDTPLEPRVGRHKPEEIEFTWREPESIAFGFKAAEGGKATVFGYGFDRPDFMQKFRLFVSADINDKENGINVSNWVHVNIPYSLTIIPDFGRDKDLSDLLVDGCILRLEWWPNEKGDGKRPLKDIRVNCYRSPRLPDSNKLQVFWTHDGKKDANGTSKWAFGMKPKQAQIFTASGEPKQISLEEKLDLSSINVLEKSDKKLKILWEAKDIKNGSCEHEFELEPKDLPRKVKGHKVKFTKLQCIKPGESTAEVELHINVDGTEVFSNKPNYWSMVAGSVQVLGIEASVTTSISGLVVEIDDLDPNDLSNTPSNELKVLTDRKSGTLDFGVDDGQYQLFWEYSEVYEE